MRVKTRLNLHRMKQLLQERGLSQYGLAKAAGLSHGHVVMLLQGRRPNPSIATVHKIAKALDVPVEELLEEDDVLATR